MEAITAPTPCDLARQITELCRDKFVVNCQVFQDEEQWVGLIHYRVRG